MVKILTVAAHTALMAKADNYDAVVGALVASNEGLTAEDVTLEVIQGAMSADDAASAARVLELEASEGVLNSTIATLTTERDSLQSQVDAFAEIPGAESAAGKKPAAEATAVATDDVLEFAIKNKGNTLAIAAKMKEAGLV